jgi:hypothetical protein
MVNVIVPKAAFDAQVALVNNRIEGRGHFEDSIIFDV